MSISTIIFEKISKFLFKRIFEDLDKNLFNEINLTPINNCQTSHLYHLIPEDYIIDPPSLQFKNQIFIYTRFIHLIEDLQLTEFNYEYVIYFFEYQYLVLKQPNAGLLTRLDILDMLCYFAEQIPPETLLICEVKTILIHMYGKEQFINEVVSFMDKCTIITKNNLDTSLAMGYAFEKFKYPMIDNTIESSGIKDPQLIHDFFLFYFHRLSKERDDKLPNLIDVIERFINRYGVLSEEIEEEQMIYLLDQISLLTFGTGDIIVQSIQSSKEFKERLGHCLERISHLGRGPYHEYSKHRELKV
ncbi:hypothetical protein JA1_003772 [Spathaspora sp. JA1]|nr:hypothetical protein JA1_003772 [Spathaspora sp. JA1]